MTVYKLPLSHGQESLFYAYMAERISLVLNPHYTTILKGQGYTVEEKREEVHYKRLQNHLHYVLTFEQIPRYNPREQLKARSKDLPFCTLLHMGEGTWQVAQDDSIQEKWFAEMHGYILQLQRGVQKVSKHAQSCDMHQLIGLIGHNVEMAMQHWYHHILPPEFKLTLPLFGSTVDDCKYYTTLERECAHSAIPVLTTLALYDEWLVLGQAYLPKIPPSAENISVTLDRSMGWRKYTNTQNK
jgi:hypothetical protein